MNLSLGHNTGAFARGSFRWFWEHIGYLAHKSADRILLLRDCGGRNSFRSNVFKYRLAEVSAVIGLPIRVTHLPAYCSKYNPIARRGFPWVEQAYSGQIFTAVVQMVEAITRLACTSTGYSTTAHAMTEEFKPAMKHDKTTNAGITIEYPESLNDYNYRVTPKMLQ